ncbi:MAG: hypothetical protein HYX67_03405, partial [Candidatus Melainabacteria bacterium]|nr:hypothetical protein [Candidatus Melainabacteria bacterium]
QQLTRTGEVFGSPLYMSPEQCSGSPVDHRSDIYSLGCVLFETLTGTPPHLGANALRTMMLHQSEPAPMLKQASLGKSFPPALEEVVKKMLQKDPNDRYQDMVLVANDLNAVLANRKLAKPKAATSAVAKAPKMITISQEKLQLLFSATVLITASVSLAVAIPLTTSWNKMVSQVSKTEPMQLDNDPGKVSEKQNLGDIEFFNVAGSEVHDRHPEVTKLLFDNCNTIKSEKIVENGKKFRRFVFPERAIGTISCRVDSPGNDAVLGQGETPDLEKDNLRGQPEKEWEARGIVVVPDDVPLMLHISGKRCPEIFHLTNIIAKIDANEFSQLGISSNIMEDRDVQAKGLQNILDIVSRWKKLQGLSIIGLPISAESIENLGKLKHLSTIVIESPNVDFKLLAAQTFWERLDSVSLKNTSGDEIVSKLSHSKNLQTLKLSKTKISPLSLASLRNCKNLNYLMLDNPAISSELLNSITELKHLDTLYLKHVLLQSSQLNTFDKMPWLKQIILSPSSLKTVQSTGYSDKRISYAD